MLDPLLDFELAQTEFRITRSQRITVFWLKKNKAQFYSMNTKSNVSSMKMTKELSNYKQSDKTECKSLTSVEILRELDRSSSSNSEGTAVPINVK